MINTLFWWTGAIVWFSLAAVVFLALLFVGISMYIDWRHGWKNGVL